MREEGSNRETYIHIRTIARFWKRETRERKREKRKREKIETREMNDGKFIRVITQV